MKVIDAFNEAQGEVESLAEEMRSWFDNMPENLQGGDKGGMVDEAANTLEGIDMNIDLPASVHEVEITERLVGRQRRRPSRGSRRDRIAGLIDSIVEVLRNGPEDAPDHEEREDAAEMLDTAKDELEGVEFPGMY